MPRGGPSGHGPAPEYAPRQSPLARAPTAALGSGSAGARSTPPSAVVVGTPSTPPRAEVPRDASGKPAFGPVKRFGDYTLIKKLATGGMAEIWLARQTGIAGFARFLVVKKILSHLAEQETFVRMFQDEARTSALLSHPNIVQIHDLGRAEGTYYIAMEYIAGENLAAIAWRGMKRGRPFPPAFAAHVIASACKALHYAHELVGNDGRPLEIVHRDVSPQNILVTYEGEVKVVDFGIAKAATKTEHTKTGMLKGKFSYMSPEQCLGAPVDRRSDIFALGILLYELCTGKRLYKHESELMILDMITKRSVVPPSEVSPGIPKDLEAIIMRALEKDVEGRFQTAQEMQLALEDDLRRSPDVVNDAAISAYMRALFADKIEEKRRLRERASRDDFEALFLDDEATVRGAPARRVVHGASPSQVRVMRGSQPTAAFPSPPSGTSSAYPSASWGPATSDPHPPPTPWLTRVLVGLAILIILGAGAVLVRHLTRPPEVLTTTAFTPPPTTRPPPIRTGALTLESSPAEAVIHLDGEPMLLADGTPARTPSDLKGLLYGRNYSISLEKDGYRPHVIDVAMGEAADGQVYHPTLEPFPGRIVTEVRGQGASEVEIRYDGERVGTGPRVSVEMPGNSTVLVEASLPGRVCRARPARVRVRPNETATTQVECRSAPRPPPPPAGARPPSRSRPASSRAGSDEVAHRSTTRSPPPRPKGGCVTNPDLPPGFVTIATKPYSTVYWGDRELGQTPISSKRLPAGCVELRAVAEDGSSRTVKVEVEPNLTRVYKFDI